MGRYRAEVLGRTRLDKLLKITAGRTVEISITNWGGTFVLITGDFDHAHSRFIIATQPLDDGKTLCEGMVFTPRMKNPLARALCEPLTLAVRRFFTHGYLKDEAKRLLGTRYNPATMIPPDRDIIDFFNWVVALPQNKDNLSFPTNASHNHNGSATHRLVPTAPAVLIATTPSTTTHE